MTVSTYDCKKTYSGNTYICFYFSKHSPKKNISWRCIVVQRHSDGCRNRIELRSGGSPVSWWTLHSSGHTECTILHIFLIIARNNKNLAICWRRPWSCYSNYRVIKFLNTKSVYICLKLWSSIEFIFFISSFI